jgi:hypothetical protein
MPDLDDLHRLAPEVDEARAADAFRRRRRRARVARRSLVGLGAAAALASVVAAVAIVARDDDPSVVAGPSTDDHQNVMFSVLSTHVAVDEMGTLRAATDQPGYEELWSTSGASGAAPEVHMPGSVVVSITIPDDACPPDLTGFERAGDTITPLFREPPGGCNEPLIPKTYVVALARSLLEPGFTLRLPADDIYGFGEQRLRVELGETPTSTLSTTALSPEPTCTDIERFAEVLVDTGITYDYDATSSPEELFAQADAVLFGDLTGQWATEEDVDAGTEAVGYQIDVRGRFKGEGTQDVVWVERAASMPDIDFGDTVLRGIPVIAFAHLDGGALYASIEGFITACSGGPPIGFVGGQGEWASMQTLDGILLRVEQSAGG